MLALCLTLLEAERDDTLGKFITVVIIIMTRFPIAKYCVGNVTANMYKK